METPRAIPHDMWEQLPPEAQAYIRALEARVEALEAMVQVLQEHNRALQEQLHQTSRNSSRPLASDPPHSERPHRPRSKRRRGGQPGHPGHTRPLLPVEAVDEVVVIKPEQCAPCHAPLSGDDPTPWRHQVIEIPPITPVVTEYQWHQLVCATCGEVPRAPWPAGSAQWDLWSSGASDGGAVYGVVSLVQTHDAADDGRGVWRADACGDDQPVGAGHHGSGRRARRGSPHLRARASRGPPRRDERAPRGQAGLVMGRGDELGDGVGDTHVTRGPRGP